jgi:hypothetical protein
MVAILLLGLFIGLVVDAILLQGLFVGLNLVGDHDDDFLLVLLVGEIKVAMVAVFLLGLRVGV